ncbi:MAG: carboxypeptidase-like regulatory domain-containing protein [Haloarculaceae archaeon]
MRGRRILLLVVVGSLLFAANPGVATAAEQVTLTVSVVDGQGNSVPDAELNATWDGGSTTATTASNGKAFVDVPAEADVEIAVSHPDYVRNFPVEVRDASARDVTVQVAPKGRAAVHVTNPGGAPVSNADVRVLVGARIVTSGQTGSDGVFRTGVVEQRDYRVHVVKPGYVSNETMLSVNESARTTLSISQQTVLLGVTVVDDHFDPPRRVENVSIAVGDVATVRAANGRSAVTVPVNDDYTVSVEREGYATAEQRVDVRESGKNVSVVMNREPSLSVEPTNRRVVVGEVVRVTVTDEYGEPVVDATVSVGDETAATTGDDGVATVAIDAAGENRIRAAKGGVTSAAVNVTGVSTATTTREPTTTATTTTTEATTTTTTTTGFGPGFGAPAALVALGAALLARRVAR